MSLSDIILLSGNILPVNQDLTGIHRNAPTDNIQHGGLPRTVASNDRDEFTVLHRKVKILEQTDLVDRTGIIVLTDSL